MILKNGYKLFGYHNNVCQAVIEFAVEKKLHLYVQAPDWWLVKGGTFIDEF